jgi:hypothetical protein
MPRLVNDAMIAGRTFNTDHGGLPFASGASPLVVLLFFDDVASSDDEVLTSLRAFFDLLDT